MRSQKRTGDEQIELPTRKRKKNPDSPVLPATNSGSRVVDGHSENLSASPIEHSPTSQRNREQISTPVSVSGLSITERERMETLARIQAAKHHMEVEKRAIEDRRRLELEMIDTRFQEEMLAIGDASMSGTSLQTRSYCQSSVNNWLASLPDQGQPNIVDTPRRQNDRSRRERNVSFSPDSVTTSELAERLIRLRNPVSTLPAPRTVIEN